MEALQFYLSHAKFDRNYSRVVCYMHSIMGISFQREAEQRRLIYKLAKYIVMQTRFTDAFDFAVAEGLLRRRANDLYEPVYSKEMAEFLLQSLDEINAELGTHTTLIFGFFPVVNYKVAIFLRDKLPGVFIPDTWITQLQNAKANEYEVGLELSRDLLTQLRSLHDKIHFMSANKLELVREFY